MPIYIQGSHNVADKENWKKLPQPQICLGEGDVLIWKGGTVMYSLGQEGGGYFVQIRIWPRPSN